MIKLKTVMSRDKGLFDEKVNELLADDWYIKKLTRAMREGYEYFVAHMTKDENA